MDEEVTRISPKLRAATLRLNAEALDRAADKLYGMAGVADDVTGITYLAGANRLRREAEQHRTEASAHDGC